MRLLAIDPGTTKLGWALFEYTKFIRADVLKLKTRASAECFKVNQRNHRSALQLCHASQTTQESAKFLLGNQWLQRVVDAQARVNELIKEYSPLTVVIETPEHHGGAKGSKAEGSGAILKLMFLVGFITQSLVDQGLRVRLVKVRNWKGTVKKEMTQARMRRRWGDLGTTSPDAIDAIGIGTWYLCKRKP